MKSAQEIISEEYHKAVLRDERTGAHRSATFFEMQLYWLRRVFWDYIMGQPPPKRKDVLAWQWQLWQALMRGQHR